MNAHDRVRRACVLPARTLLALGLIIATYAIVASELGFYPLAIPNDGLDAASIRLTECGVLWYVLCALAGWWRRHRGRRAPTQARCWPIAVPLLFLGLTVAAVHAVKYTSPWPGSLPGAGSTVLWIALGISVIGPILVAAGGAYSLQLQARCYWLLPADPATVCPGCGYDLRGNSSGRCSECGIVVERNREIPRSLYTLSGYWFLPELARFASAGERYAAWKRVSADDRKSKRDGIIVIVVVGVLVMLNQSRWRRWLEQHWLSATVLMGTVWLILIASARRRMRRGLRRELEHLANATSATPSNRKRNGGPSCTGDV